MGNFTFIGISLIGFAVIFILLLILPRVKGKSDDHSIPKKSPLTSHRSVHPQSTGAKRVYRI